MKVRYNQQKDNARRRGIEWKFTYETWMTWWGEDIINRGKRKGQLVMARIGDNGPYCPDNCIKLTQGQNTSDAHLGKKQNTDWILKRAKKLKVSNLGKTLNKESIAKREATRIQNRNDAIARGESYGKWKSK